MEDLVGKTKEGRGKMRKNLILLFLLIIVLVFVIFQQRENFYKGSNEEELNEKHIFVPYNGEINIIHDTKANLDGMSHEEIASFRIKKVKEYEILNFYHPEYDPFKPPHNRIYGMITPYKDWLTPVPYYIANPYLLIILTCANHVTPLNWYCPEVQIKYSSRKIEEIRKGESAICWFEKVFTSPDYPGQIRAVMVNAFDAGFYYSTLDISRSFNIEESIDPENIANTVHTGNAFYHVGKYRVNNLSPENRKEWIKIKERDKDTKLYFKLWRKKPESKDSPPDIVFEFKILPSQH